MTPDTKGAWSYESVLPHIKKKYMWILILLAIVAVLLPTYIVGWQSIVVYIMLWVFAILCLMMYKDMYCFQKYSFKCRPFVVTKWLMRYALVFTVVVIVFSIPEAVATHVRVPYLVLWWLTALVPRQFKSMFTLAKHHKADHPDRCEFF